MFTLYIFYSEKLERFYVGYSNNLERRIGEHNSIKGKYIDQGIPWMFVYTEEYQDKKSGMNRGRFIKSKKSKQFILDPVVEGKLSL